MGKKVANQKGAEKKDDKIIGMEKREGKIVRLFYDSGQVLGLSKPQTCLSNAINHASKRRNVYV